MRGERLGCCRGQTFNLLPKQDTGFCPDPFSHASLIIFRAMCIDIVV